MSESVAAAELGGNTKNNGVTIHVKHLGEHEKKTFKVAASQTLQQIWIQAYLELAIAKQDRDVFQVRKNKQGNPIDLAPYFSLSLKTAQDEGICDDDFEIAAGTGGA
jgi:hypothetical protein